MTISRIDRLARILLSGFAVIVLLAGCSASGGAATRGSSAATPSEAPTALPIESVLGVVPSRNGPGSGANPSGGRIELPPSTIGPVVADIASRAGIAPDQVKVLSAENVTFPDGSLGCPQPGVAYTQMVVDGYKVLAQANGFTYDYRGSGTTFRLCSQTPS